MQKNRLILVSGAALAVMMLFAVFTWLTYSTGTPRTKGITYQTSFGEQRTITLADGSTVQLNSDTWMHVALDGDDRKIVLTQGQALFKVAKDTRPFKVAGGTGEVTALGSTFEIEVVDASKMLVTVEQGRVMVSSQGDTLQPREVTALQQLAVTDQELGPVRQLSKIEADWRDGWLEFDNAELAHVAAELDKYYRGNIILALDEARLSKMRVTGRYHIPDIQKAIRILARSMKLEIERTESGDIIMASPDSESRSNHQ